MKIENSRAALIRSPRTPDEISPVHALLLLETPHLGIERYKLEDLRRKLARHKGLYEVDWNWNRPYAMCGWQVRVIYPMTFDTEEADACTECKSLAVVRSTDPDEYRRQAAIVDQKRRDRERRWRMKDIQRERRERFEEELNDASRETRQLGEMPPQLDPNHPDHWVFPALHDEEPDGARDSG